MESLLYKLYRRLLTSQQMSWPALTCIVIQFPLQALVILQARVQDVLVKVTNQDVTVAAFQLRTKDFGKSSEEP